MKNTVSKIASVLAMTGGVFAVLTGSALADTKVYQAASICSGGTPGATAGTMNNNSSVLAVTTYCAINRDRTDLKPTAVQVTVVDHSSVILGDGNFSCSLTPVSRAGVTGAPGAAAVTAGTNSAGQVLSLAIPGVVPVDGTLTLKCKIPRRGVGDPASLVGSIKVIEPDPTN